MEGLTEGRVVHFVLAKDYKIENGMGGTRSREEKIICRPAMIVNAWEGKLEDGMINLVVQLDGSNDSVYTQELTKFGAVTFIPYGYDLKFYLPHTLWATSVKYSETKEIGTWHWPERA